MVPRSTFALATAVLLAGCGSQDANITRIVELEAENSRLKQQIAELEAVSAGTAGFRPDQGSAVERALEAIDRQGVTSSAVAPPPPVSPPPSGTAR